MGGLRLLTLAGLVASCVAAPAALGSWRQASGDWGRSQALALTALSPDAARFSAEITAHPDTASSEEADILAEVARAEQSETVRFPVLEALAKAQARHSDAAGRLRSDAETLLMGALGAYGRQREEARWYLWSGALGSAGLALAALLLSMHGLARFLATAVSGAAGLWLRLLSWGAPAAALWLHLNVWAVLPRELLAAPFAALLSGAAVLKLVDENVPVWNGALGGCAWTLGSAVAVAALQRAFG